MVVFNSALVHTAFSHLSCFCRWLSRSIAIYDDVAASLSCVEGLLEMNFSGPVWWSPALAYHKDRAACLKLPDLLHSVEGLLCSYCMGVSCTQA